MILLAGSKQPEPENLCYAVKLESIPGSDAPAVSEYHLDKSCIRYPRDMKNPAEGFGKPWAANPADNTWTRKSFTVCFRNGKLVDGYRKAWNSNPGILCVN